MSERSQTLRELRERLQRKLAEGISDAPPPPRPKLVCVNGKVVGDAVVIVSERDPNWWRGMAVRRNGEIRVSPEHGVGRRL
jgi:hypothetical protein